MDRKERAATPVSAPLCTTSEHGRRLKEFGFSRAAVFEAHL